MASGLTHQAILTKRFSKSKELEKLHQASHGGEAGGVRGFYFRRVLLKFHEVKRKVKEEAMETGTIMPDDLALMAMIAGGMSYGRVYGVGSEAAHLRARSMEQHLVED
ncbi:hypothetical protein M9H77_30708 [Catharanthus roseus]|uniref:Uncharacterized protein n=1 Tax=Catharanthus roseus TaxID=4058 RepID=A0ACC0A1X6_CATRO|nr:hypothetical protein M9H77_30708 [Catharanthus roseus]